jgi:DNA-binding NtrC family response regulator
MAKPIVLVVDDEPDIRDLLSMTLERMDLLAETAADLGEARDKLSAGACLSPLLPRTATWSWPCGR